MATEYEVGQRIKLDETVVSLSPGTPEAAQEYQWAFIAGDADTITMSEVDAEANLVTSATALAFTPSAAGAVRGAVKAENTGGSDTVWYPQANFRVYPDVYTDDFSSYASDAELRAAWPKVSGSGDLFTLVNDARTPSGKAALLDNQDVTSSKYEWLAPSQKPANANFKLYMEIFLDRPPDTTSPRDFWFEARGGAAEVRYDEVLIPTFDYYSIVWELSEGILKHKTWLKTDPEPADTAFVEVSVSVQNGPISFEPKNAGDRRIGYISIAFNGQEPVRPA